MHIFNKQILYIYKGTLRIFYVSNISVINTVWQYADTKLCVCNISVINTTETMQHFNYESNNRSYYQDKISNTLSGHVI